MRLTCELPVFINAFNKRGYSNKVGSRDDNAKTACTCGFPVLINKLAIVGVKKVRVGAGLIVAGVIVVGVIVVVIIMNKANRPQIVRVKSLQDRECARFLSSGKWGSVSYIPSKFERHR